MRILSTTTAFAAFATLSTLAFPASGLAQDTDEFLRYFRQPGRVEFTDFMTTNPSRRTDFDMRQYVSHPCFDIVGHEREYCEEMFGEYADLRMLLENGTLERLLIEQGLLGPTEATLIDTAQEQVDETGNDDAEPEPLSPWEIRRDRAERIWAICNERTDDWRMRAQCFQRNQRLVEHGDMPIDESTVR